MILRTKNFSSSVKIQDLSNNFFLQDMSTPASPPSPDRSSRNANGEDAKSFYVKNSPQAAFAGGNYWSNNAGTIDEDEAEADGNGASTDGFLDEGVSVPDAFKSDVFACVTFMRKQDSKDWHVSNVNSTTRNDDGSSSLDLVLCSGDLCSMKKFTVSKAGVVTVEKAGLF